MIHGLLIRFENHLKRLVAGTFFSVLLAGSLFAQNSYSIGGYVKDGESGEMLPGATIRVKDSNAGAFSNNYGFWSLRYPEDSLTLMVTFVGYKPLLHTFYLDRDTTLEYELSPQGVTVDEVVIVDDGSRDAIERNQMSYSHVSMEVVREIPALMGEVDVMKSLQLLPGVQSGSEGNGGIYVRGGGPDQNLIMLDEAPIYNADHLFGFFSIFNGDAVSGIDLYKGAFPARYGGKLSSVVDVSMREGNMRKYGVSGGLGLISSRVTVEGPIKKDKASFLVSGRRTYADLFTGELNKAFEDNEKWIEIPDYYFHDLNGKVNWRINQKDRLFLSGYYGRDKLQYIDDDFSLDFGWGNTTGTLRWNHMFSEKLFLNTSVVFSDFRYNIENERSLSSSTFYSRIRDLTFKTDFDFFPHEKHVMKFGAHYTWHALTPRGFTNSGSSASLRVDGANEFLHSHETALYFSDDISLSSRIKLNPGIRLSIFHTQEKTFVNPEPRLGFLWRMHEKVSLKAGLSRMTQSIHLITNTAITLPTDLWYPSTAQTKPEISDQAALGVSYMPMPGMELTVEGFGKYFRNLVEYAPGANFIIFESLDQQLTYGRGWSYGMEFLFKKSSGKFSGWLGYTLSWTWRQFDILNNGNPYPNKFDRRHDLSLVLNYEINKKLTLSATWVLGTGNAYTMPLGRYIILDMLDVPPRVVPEVSERNSLRLPTYHRGDIGLTWNIKPEKDHHKLNFSVYNVYNRRNIFFIYFDDVKDDDGNVLKYVARQASLFPIIPSVTYNFNF